MSDDTKSRPNPRIDLQTSSMSSSGLCSESAELSGVGRLSEMFAAVLRSSSSEKSIDETSVASILSVDCKDESVRAASGREGFS